MSEGRVEDIYQRLKAKAVAFHLRPGDRLNEGALAKEFGVSRTPLREALNRLVAEKFFEFRAGAGFFCRGLEAQEIFDLYEMRRILEVASVRAACERATDGELLALNAALYERGLEIAGLTVAEACARDEAFHMGIAGLAGNEVVIEHLERINERTRFIRWIEMSQRIARSKEQHKVIMAALLERDAERAADELAAHIDKRMDQILNAVREGIANIYMDGTAVLSEQVLGEGA